jgi:hypothetical protein
MMKDKLKSKILVLLVAMVLLGGIFWGWKKLSETDKNVVFVNNPAATNEESVTPADEAVPAEPEAAVESDPAKTEESVAVVPPAQTEAKVEKVVPKKSAATFSGIKQKLISWGFQKTNGRTIDTIVLHSSYDALGSEPYSVSGILEEYRQYEVSAHYLMDRQGQLYQLVEDENIAYHAGVAKLPDGRTNVNAVSIGIELMNTKSDEFTQAQYETLNKFLDFLQGEYKIKYVLGHSQVAPGRKDDPWNFDWNKIK